MRLKLGLVCLLAACGGPKSPPQPPATPPVTDVTTTKPQPPTTGTPASAHRLAIGNGDFGTAHPTILRRVDPDERWMALCQARKDTDGDGKIEFHVGHHGATFGDTLDQYLVLGGGPGTLIDALVDASDDMRWIAILRGGTLELVDSTTGEIFGMKNADVASDNRPGAPHRAGMFAGDRLLYVRHRTAGDALVVHELATHTEREIAVPDRLWRIGSAGKLTQLYTVPGNDFPQLRTSLDAGECLGAPMSYSTGGQSGPQPTERVIDLDQGKVAAASGVITVIDATVVREKAGALYLDNDEIAPATCKPQVLAMLKAPARVIAICGAKKQAKVLLLGKGLRVELASIDRDKDNYEDFTGALEPATGVVCDAGLHCVATKTNARIDLKGGVAEYAFGNKLYVVHATMSSRTHEIIDVATGTRTPIKSSDKKLAAGRYLIDYDDRLIDLETATVGPKVTDPRRLSAAGRVLRFATPDTGPVRWTKP